jgi:cytochrome o ubiquinol oxidase subunit III
METETERPTLLGFWTYLMTDCILFAILFATYAVLHTQTYGSPSVGELLSFPFLLTQTLILLTSSFTSGMAMVGGQTSSKRSILLWFVLTFLLGASFIAIELTEFSRFVQEGHSWRESASLSAFFILVGTHGLHVSIGLLWMIVFLVPVWRHGVTALSFTRLTCLRLYWHLLDVVWIFIFTYVYLMGAR